METYSKWETSSYCSGCDSINSYDGAYITCGVCGNTGHSFKPMRKVYMTVPFLKFFKRSKLIAVEVKFYNKVERFKL